MSNNQKLHIDYYTDSTGKIEFYDLTNELITFERKRKNEKKNDEFFKKYKDKQLKCFNSLLNENNNEFLDINNININNNANKKKENELIELNDNLEKQINERYNFICNYNRLNKNVDILNFNNIEQNDYKVFKINIPNIPK